MQAKYKLEMDWQFYFDDETETTNIFLADDPALRKLMK